MTFSKTMSAVSAENDVSVCNSIDKRLYRLQHELGIITQNAATRRQVIPGTRRRIQHEKIWRYCKKAAIQSANRARAAGVPHAITAHDIDALFCDQDYRCAVSGIIFDSPGDRKNPFGPSLDRIIPSRGYVFNNVRVVCQIVNMAMNAWGEEALRLLVDVMAAGRP